VSPNTWSISEGYIRRVLLQTLINIISVFRVLIRLYVVISNHVPFTIILIPIAFPCKNPIPNSRKIHDRIHSRSQLDSRLYLSSSCRFSHLTCSSELFHHTCSQCSQCYWLTNKSTYPWQTSQSIIHRRISPSSWPSTTGTVSPNSATNMNNWEGLDQYAMWNILSTKRLTTRLNVNSIAHCFHRLHLKTITT
jgi:hypothetical protein